MCTSRRSSTAVRPCSRRWIACNGPGRPNGGAPDGEAFAAYADALRPAWARRLKELGDRSPHATSTTNLCVLDRDGNVAVVTQTLLSLFGARFLLPDSGILMNNGINWFDPRPGAPNSIAAGKRVLSNYTPTIAVGNGDVIGLGGAGGRKIMPAVFNLLSFMIDYGMTLEDAMHAPRIDVSGPDKVVADWTLGEAAIATIGARHPTVAANREGYPYNFTIASAVRRRNGAAEGGCRALAALRRSRRRMSAFKDHFSTRSAEYAAYRPTYPRALVDFLADAAPGTELALDCGCGTGQLSVLLGERFARVVATDASQKQIENAEPHARVAYRVAPAEASGLGDASADLVVAAQAAHWFDLPAFYAEARRVARPHGVVALVTYGIIEMERAGRRRGQAFLLEGRRPVLAAGAPACRGGLPLLRFSVRGIRRAAARDRSRMDLRRVHRLRRHLVGGEGGREGARPCARRALSARARGGLGRSGDDPAHAAVSAVAAGRTGLTLDQLEPVDVDEPAVGDLQMRDHRQRQERDLQERLGKRDAERPRGRAERKQRVADGLERAVAHQAGDRQRQLGPDRAVGGHDKAALERDDAVDRHRHVAVVGADDADVVAVMPDRGGDRAALEAEAVDEAERRCCR